MSRRTTSSGWAPNERKTIALDVLWREPATRSQAVSDGVGLECQTRRRFTGYPMITTLNHSVLATDLRLPEGPAFAPDGSLWAVEMKSESLIRWQDGVLTRFWVGGIPNGIAFDRQGTLWFCDAGQNDIRTFDVAMEQTQPIVDRVGDEILANPNDLAFDSVGNLVFTCPGNSRQQPTGYVCVRQPDGHIKKITEGKFFPNGLAFSPDGQQLILAETYRHRLWTGDWNDQTATWSNTRVWASVDGPNGPGGPDGMAFGPDGLLYVAVYGTGTIQVIDTSGQIVCKLDLPGQNPTNCTFDPSGELGLVITEADRGELLTFSAFTKSIVSSINHSI